MTRRGKSGAGLLGPIGLAVTLSLAGCASLDAVAPGQSASMPAQAATPADPLAQSVSAFEVRQRAAAQDAEQQGDWAQAAWAWEALHAVLPNDAEVANRMQLARNAAESRATLLTQQARLALQLNDLDGARQLFMRALMAQPVHTEAIDGLRSLEDTRLRGLLVAPDPARPVAPRTPQARMQSDFASMLVAQGEIERAAELLQPLAGAPRADPALRRQLSDIYLLLAESQHGADPAQAIASARKSLQMDSRNRRAASLLREWRRAAATPRKGSAP